MGKERVKVRVAVSVDPSGEWSASGWSGANDEIMRSSTVDTLAPGEAHYWMEAELEIPATKAIQPTVTRDTTTEG